MRGIHIKRVKFGHPEARHPRTVSVGRKPETKPGPPKKRILQRFGRPHPFQPIPSPRRRFPAGWIPTRPFHTRCGIKIPLIPPGQRQRKSVPSRRRSDGKPPRRLVRFLWFAAKIRQSRYPLHRLRPEKRFCILFLGVPEQKRQSCGICSFPKKRFTASLLTQWLPPKPALSFSRFRNPPGRSGRRLNGDTCRAAIPLSSGRRLSHVDRPGVISAGYRLLYLYLSPSPNSHLLG